MNLRVAIIFGLVSTLSAAQDLDLTQAEVEALSLNAGIQGQVGPCLCLRSTLLFKSFGGTWHTRTIDIRSDALLSFQSRRSIYTREIFAQTLQAGGFEILARQAPLGIGFRGVEWSRNVDLSLRRSLRAGFYALVNLARTQSLGLHLEGGVDLRRQTYNYASDIVATEIPIAIEFRHETRRAEVYLRALIGFSSVFDFAPRDARLELGGGAAVFAPIEENTILQFGIDARYERDPIWALFGVPPQMGLLEAYLGIKWEVVE